MCSERALKVVIGLALLGLSSGAALADLPADRTSEYFIRETPTDPDSDIIFVVELELTAVDQDGDEVAWKATQLTLTEPGYGGARDTVWIDDNPEPDTPDAFWWIDHADPAAPLDTEFDRPPAFLGRATAVEQSDDDLDYDFVGEDCDSACSQRFNGKVGAMTYFFQLASAQEPLEEGDDEPVEITGETIYG